MSAEQTIPILLYHKIGRPPRGARVAGHYVSPGLFRRHLAHLNEDAVNIDFIGFAGFVVSEDHVSHFDVSLDLFEFRVPQNLYLLRLQVLYKGFLCSQLGSSMSQLHI